MTDITEVPTQTDFWLTVWNDIKGFGPSFYVFLIVFTLWNYKQYIISMIDKIFGLIIGRKKEIKYTNKQLIKHQVFKDLDYWLDTGIKAIQIKSNVHTDEEEYARNKEKMAKEVIRIIFETFKETLNKFVTENDLDNMDEEVACAYLLDALKKNAITERQRYIERGISEKFIHKFTVVNTMAYDLVRASVKNIFQKGNVLDTSTKVYLAFNTFDGYLNIIFNNLVECINTINGDLKSEMFDGQPMFRAYKSRLRPPHATYTSIVKEKLAKIITETYASRANVIKYYKKDGDIYHSSIYEEVKPGVTEEINNMQMIDDENEKNILNVMKSSGIIVADISKFDNISLERFIARGLKGIIIAPIMDEENIDGALVLDYMNKESFEKFSKNKDLDNILNSQADYLKPYIAYPENYKF